MQSPGAPQASSLIDAAVVRRGRAQGHRAIVEFAPKPVSMERLCAGVVIRTNQNEVIAQCALDRRKAEHAFGTAGKAIYEVANALCESLAQHWRTFGPLEPWVPPFENARIASISDFSARDVDSAIKQALDLHSTLGTLLSHYEINEQTRTTSIVERVRTAVKRDNNAKHLAARFNRELPLGKDAAPLRVDFLGQNFACYFLQVVKHARGIEVNADRALGKLYELQTLRKFVAKPKKSLGLFDDERPKHFELVLVGNRNDSVQRRVVYQIEAMADRGEVQSRLLESPAAAAEYVANNERLAA